MPKQEVFLSEQLNQLIEKKAKEVGISVSAVIADMLESLFSDELNVRGDSIVNTYTELKKKVVAFVDKGDVSDFTLNDISYFRELGIAKISYGK
ncbi:hypothetical protein [Clostridium akagii]|uniref:hypothetical protein n=1 Tax=Clostridium akagii TaxID=91623 RepID=UPI00047A02C3|nr:hypothetical protein [Clostridium akagii]